MSRKCPITFLELRDFCLNVRLRKLSLLATYIIFVAFVCEYLIYYIAISQCIWPRLPSISTSKQSVNTTIKTLVLADPHLVGPFKGHNLDRLRRDWELRQTFQAAIYLLAPEVVFILGDIFDEGLWINDDELDSELIRYRRIFHHDPSVTILKNIVGNHDIGFHYAIHPYFDYRFRRKLTPAANSSAVRLWTHAGVHFVLANSMAFEGDECNLCSEAEYDVYAIGQYLSCAPVARSAKCDPRVDYSHPPYQLDMDSDRKRPTVYTRPILLQHFPLFRPNELACPATPLDAMPAHLRRVAYRPKWDCLSEKASQQLLRQLRPRLVLSGHSHYSCLLHHKLINGHSEELIPEITVASFTWRNVQTPSFTLLTVSPTEHATVTCFLPKQSTIFILYISSVLCFIFYCVRNSLRKALFSFIWRFLC